MGLYYLHWIAKILVQEAEKKVKHLKEDWDINGQGEGLRAKIVGLLHAKKDL